MGKTGLHEHTGGLLVEEGTTYAGVDQQKLGTPLMMQTMSSTCLMPMLKETVRLR